MIIRKNLHNKDFTCYMMEYIYEICAFILEAISCLTSCTKLHTFITIYFANESVKSHFQFLYIYHCDDDKDIRFCFFSVSSGGGRWLVGEYDDRIHGS